MVNSGMSKVCRCLAMPSGAALLIAGPLQGCSRSGLAARTERLRLHADNAAAPMALPAATPQRSSPDRNLSSPTVYVNILTQFISNLIGPTSRPPYASSSLLNVNLGDPRAYGVTAPFSR